MKLSKKYKYIIYKLSDDNKQIVVDEASADKDWENFREKLVNATTKSKSVRQTPPEDAASHCYRRDAEMTDHHTRELSVRDLGTPSTTSSTSSLPARAHGRRYTVVMQHMAPILTMPQEQDHIYRMVAG